MSVHKDQVRRFYDIIWNTHAKAAIPSVLHEDFTFRGSLGHVKRGHDGFAEYVDMVHGALGDYECVVEELVAEGGKVFAKMLFTGVHRGRFMGYAPTQQRVRWAGCALFSFRDALITDVWVLGDLKSLEAQLQQHHPPEGQLQQP